jgi:prephenate dehydrogenase
MRTTILGSAGSIGRLFARLLCDEGVSVIGVDQVVQAAGAGFTPILCNLEGVDENLRSFIFDAECIILCLPRATALLCLPLLQACLGRNTLLVDTLSVKSHVMSFSGSLDASIEFLSINPLFAPDLGIKGQNVAVVRRNTGPKTDWFIGLLERWGGRVTYMTAVQHDRTGAQTQALTHAILLCFGRALIELKYELPDAKDMQTPLHRALLSLLARMVEANPDVYWEIQSANSEARDIRSTILASCRELESISLSNDRQGFHRIFSAIRTVFGPDLTDFSLSAKRMLVATTIDPANPDCTVSLPTPSREQA